MTIRDDVRKYFEREAARHEAPRGLRAAVLGQAPGHALERRSPQWIAGAIAVVLAVAVVAGLLGTNAFLRSRGAPANPRASAARTASPTPSPAGGLTLDSVAMFGDQGWASTLDSSGPIASVLRTVDGGRTWRVVTPSGAKGAFIFGFAPIDAGRAWLMAASPSISGTAPVDLWGTTDGGQTWNRTTALAFAFRGSMMTFTDGTHGWFAVPGEPLSQYQQQGIVIDRTVDGGKSWRLVAETNWPPVKSTRGAPSLNCGKGDLSFRDASTGWLTGGCLGGITFDVTTDGGVTWKAQRLPTPGGKAFSAVCEGPCTLTAPRFVQPPLVSDPGFQQRFGLGYMVLHDISTSGNRSWLYISRDGGRSWTIHSVPGQGTYVSMVTMSVGLASGAAVDPASPWLYRTMDGGTTWHPLTTNIQLASAALDCVSVSRCWALTASPADLSTQLYETTDGGMTWSKTNARIP